MKNEKKNMRENNNHQFNIMSKIRQSIQTFEASNYESKINIKFRIINLKKTQITLEVKGNQTKKK